MLDPNRRSFHTTVRILGFVLRFIRNSKCPSSTKQQRKLQKPTISELSDEEINLSKQYFFKKATSEVKMYLKPSQYQQITTEKDEILYYNGRILPTENVTATCEMSDVMKDLSSSTFCVPVIYKHSPLAYSIVNDVHWNSKAAKHSGVETVWRYVLKIAFIIFGRELVQKFKIHCERCRYLRKKTIEVEMGPVSKHSITIAPAFYSTQVDLCGPFKAYSRHHKRTTIKVWLVVFCCMATSMKDYSTPSFIQSFIRFSCEVGYPKFMLIDEGSQLVKGCSTMRLSFNDIKSKLHKDKLVEFDTCPVGGHSVNGKVERRIRQIKESLEKNVQNERLSIIQWETVSAEVANAIHDLPLALGNIVSDFENLDLITPNRLRLGRNNERSPVSPMEVIGNPQKIIKENKKIFTKWFEAWLTFHVPKLMQQPKWFRTERDVKICDVVLFLKQEGSLISNNYQYGMIHEVIPSKDDVILLLDDVILLK